MDALTTAEVDAWLAETGDELYEDEYGRICRITENGVVVYPGEDEDGLR